MKKYITTILLLALVITLQNCSNPLESEIDVVRSLEQESFITVKQQETTDLTIEQLDTLFDSRKSNVYQSKQQYHNKKVRVTGRTSGVNEDGGLRLQSAPFKESVVCTGINKDFLLKVKKEDVIQVTGTLVREYSTTKLIDCISAVKVK